MKVAFILSFAANLILLIVSVFILPSTVAIHFGSGGNPDSWAPSYVHATIMAGVQVLVFLSVLFSAKILRKLPKSLINLPNKDYWLKGENISKTETIISHETLLFGTATLVFLFVVGLLALEANLSRMPEFSNTD